MYAGLTLVTPPAGEPVSLADAKQHSRVFPGVTVDDSLILAYISSARQLVETILYRALITQQWCQALMNFPGRYPLGYRESVNTDEYLKWSYIKLPNPPLISIDSFLYYDTNNTQYAMTQGYGNQVGNYFVDLSTEPGRACLPFAGIWPTTVLLPSSPIQITYTCGYGPVVACLVNVDTFGNVTQVGSPPPATFSPKMAGTWVTINGVSYDCLTVTSATSMVIATPPLAPITNGAFTGNVVPMPIRHAIAFLVSHFYENREPIDVGRGLVAIEIPGTVDALLAPFRVFEYTN